MEETDAEMSPADTAGRTGVVENHDVGALPSDVDVHTETLAHEEEAAGMPQLNLETFPNQIFWLVIALVAIYLILSRIALPRIAAVLAERNGTITNDIAAAEELKLRASEAEEAYKQALADARSEAQKISADTRAEIQADLDEAIAAADADIAEKTAESQRRIGEIRDQAAADVEVVAKDVAQSIVEAFGQDADDAAVNGAVDAEMGSRTA
ncbi:F0F1 ATP synthase subunit B' [Roseicyclus sp. F158]|uniref:ATP synthase subunit b n=1 Tax=Tropicimonas omnivorans TaxID=3075590 RepID=A0ABU3DDK3_9RHOB|nr:F0F1 ATP synthase subunit B' [Roseicyclus sp. F158]MDT0681800.1 F0F1 ATP synthase subunit B' [Roseicyclus sp. F158]